MSFCCDGEFDVVLSIIICAAHRRVVRFDTVMCLRNLVWAVLSLDLLSPLG
jgi:hypothetical protein